MGLAALTATQLATATYATQAGSALFGGISAYQGAKAEKEQAEINSYIGKTRAAQTDTAAREGLNSEIASMRAAFAQGGQRPNVGTMEMFRELRTVRSKERRVEFGNRMQEASQFGIAAKNAGGRATAGLMGGLVKAGPSLFDLYDLSRGPR